MKKSVLALLAVACLFVAWPARADTLIDPLLSYSCSGAGTGCAQTDNGTFAPLSTANWGFEIAPGPATGNLTLGIFLPTNLINVSTFTLPSLTDNGGLLAGLIKLGALLNVADGSSIATYLGLPNAGSFSPPTTLPTCRLASSPRTPASPEIFYRSKSKLTASPWTGMAHRRCSMILCSAAICQPAR